MATRTQDLTEFSKPIAEEMAARCGSLKHVLSAGVIALKHATPAMRELYMALATGKDVTVEDEETRIAKLIARILKASDFYGLAPEEATLLLSARQILAAHISQQQDQPMLQRRRVKHA